MKLVPVYPCWCKCLVCLWSLISSVSVGLCYVDLTFKMQKLILSCFFLRAFGKYFCLARKQSQLLEYNIIIAEAVLHFLNKNHG